MILIPLVSDVSLRSLALVISLKPPLLFNSNIEITESQNHSGWKGPFEIIYSNPLLK